MHKKVIYRYTNLINERIKRIFELKDFSKLQKNQIVQNMKLVWLESKRHFKAILKRKYSIHC